MDHPSSSSSPGRQQHELLLLQQQHQQQYGGRSGGGYGNASKANHVDNPSGGNGPPVFRGSSIAQQIQARRGGAAGPTPLSLADDEAEAAVIESPTIHRKVALSSSSSSPARALHPTHAQHQHQHQQQQQHQQHHQRSEAYIQMTGGRSVAAAAAASSLQQRIGNGNPHGGTAGAPRWNVPNPLTSAEVAAQRLHHRQQQQQQQQQQQHQQHQQQQQQQHVSAHHSLGIPRNSIHPSAASVQHHHHQPHPQVSLLHANPRLRQHQHHISQQQEQQQQQHQLSLSRSHPTHNHPMSHSQQPQHQPDQLSMQHRHVNMSTHPQQSHPHDPASAPSHRRRLELNSEQRDALTRAVISSFQSAAGSVDPTAMAEAIRVTGLTESAIINAAAVARNRDARKKRAQQIATPQHHDHLHTRPNQALLQQHQHPNDPSHRMLASGLSIISHSQLNQHSRGQNHHHQHHSLQQQALQMQQQQQQQQRQHEISMSVSQGRAIIRSPDSQPSQAPVNILRRNHPLASNSASSPPPHLFDGPIAHITSPSQRPSSAGNSRAHSSHADTGASAAVALMSRSRGVRPDISQMEALPSGRHTSSHLLQTQLVHSNPSSSSTASPSISWRDELLRGDPSTMSSTSRTSSASTGGKPHASLMRLKSAVSNRADLARPTPSPGPPRSFAQSRPSSRNGATIGKGLLSRAMASGGKPVASVAAALGRARAQTRELTQWKHLHHGLFVLGDNRNSVNVVGSLGPVIRGTTSSPNTSSSSSGKGAVTKSALPMSPLQRLKELYANNNVVRQSNEKKPTSVTPKNPFLEIALSIQKRLRLDLSQKDKQEGDNNHTTQDVLVKDKQIQSEKEINPSNSLDKRRQAVASLLNPNQYRRAKPQLKKDYRQLERNLRQQRKAAVDRLTRRQKDIHKAILVHREEFFRYHRLRKADTARLAKSIRDIRDRNARQKEKDAAAAERARIAALRANDMEAYAALLEETRNERLKFLLDKTDECIGEISGLLERNRTDDQGEKGVEGTSIESGLTKMSSYYSSAHVKAEAVRQPSILEGGSLKEYQLSGLQWLVSLYNNKLNGILADEMGLGKTVQAIALISYLIEYKSNRGPYLVIVPLSTLSNWVSEFAKWCPSAIVITYKGNPTERKYLFRERVRKGHFNVLLTTYEFIIKDKSSLRKLTWQYAIVDEGHRMKNAQSKFAVVLGSQYTTVHRVLLTGTPLQNSLPELWALLNFLLPKIFNSVDTFEEWFNKPFASFGGGGAAMLEQQKGNSESGEGKDDEDEDGSDFLTNEERMLIIHRLHELLRPFMLRRVKSEVLDQLPEKIEKVVKCELSSWQKALYKQISEKVALGIDKSMNRSLNNVVMQLRKVCNHPYLFTPEGYYVNDDLIKTSGKFEILDRMLPKLKAGGHRILMFTQMTAVMNILEDYFTYRGHSSLRLDGSTSADDRAERMALFNADDSPYFIFLLSTRAGGLGLNLATADTVILFDSDWNPMMDLQAQDRAHRIGQLRTVSVFRLVTNSPVEEKILSRATEKLNMSEIVVEAGKFDKSSVEKDNSVERMKLMEVLLTDFDTTTSSKNATSNGADAEQEEEDDEGRDVDADENELNELLSRNETDFRLYCKLDAEMALSEENGEESPITRSPGLYTGLDDLPDWIRRPKNGKGQKNGAKDGGDKDERKTDVVSTSGVQNSGLPSKRRAAATKAKLYDDGMTDDQFCRLLEKQADAVQMDAEVRKRSRKQSRLETENTVAKSHQKDDEKTDIVSEKSTPSRKNKKRKRTSQPVPVPAAGDIEKPTNEPPNAPVGPKDDFDLRLAPETFRTFISITKSVANLREHGTDRIISDLFMEKPCKKTYPSYYQHIKRPIAINDILRKCKAKAYTTTGEFHDDWATMFSNARIYNVEGSWVYIDAGTLENEFKRLMEKNGLGKEEEAEQNGPRIKVNSKSTSSAASASDGDYAPKKKNHSSKNSKRQRPNGTTPSNKKSKKKKTVPEEEVSIATEEDTSATYAENGHIIERYDDSFENNANGIMATPDVKKRVKKGSRRSKSSHKKR